MKKILAYDKLQDLKKLDLENEESLIITAYKDTANVILLDLPNANAISMGEIIDEIFEFWNNKEKQYENIVNIRKILKDNSNTNIVKRFSKCLGDIYNSLRVAKELNILTMDYEKFVDTDEEELFLNLMEKIYMEDNFIAFDIKLYNYDKNIELFKEDFDRTVKNILKKGLLDLSNSKFRIYLQGFYYITPIQERMIYWLKKLGYEIIPVLCFEPKNTEVNGIIIKTFENKEIEYISSLEDKKMYIGDIFAKTLNGQREIKSQSAEDLNTISFKAYDDMNTYNKTLLNCKDKIYAVNRNTLIDRLSVFGGGITKQKKLSIKFQSIGIFLKEIYSMWNSNKKSINIDIDSLCKIFETGMLKSKSGTISKEFLEDLRLIANYFIDCEILNQWQDRINVLRDNIINCQYDKIKEFYGPFSIEIKRLDEIIEILEEVKKITDIIFYEDDYDIDMNIHLKNLEQIVEKNIYTEQDNDIVKAMLKKIKEIIECRQSSIRVNNNYLYDAINFYINSIDNEEEEESDLQVFTLDSIEGIDNRCCNEITISDFDRDSFPSKKATENLFLNKNKLNKIKELKNLELEKNVISRQLIILENSDLIGRYVFWLLLKAPVNKILSRLINVDKNNEHFYESLLKELGVESTIERSKGKGLTEKKDIDCELYKLEEKKTFDGNKITKYCYLRGFYYRLNNNKEYYTENFAIEHFFANLFSFILYEDNKIINYDRMLDELWTFFPQYPKLFKEKIKRITIGNRKSSQWNENEFWIPKNFNIKENHEKFKQEISMKNNLDSDQINNFIINGILPVANSKKNSCEYCPNRDKCKERYAD